MRHIGRRGAMVGIIGTFLAACGLGGRSDVGAVKAALQSAVDGLSEHLDGVVQYVDSASAGTTINGVLTLTGKGSDEVAQSLTTVLETVIRTYADQPRVRTAHVRLEAHPDGDLATRVRTADVVAPTDGTTVTTDDLAAHFGV